MKEVVLTGATGFVGANLARRLVSDGHKVNLLVRPGSNLWRINDIKENLQIHQVHIEDQGCVSKLIAHLRPQWIFHLAVHGAYSWQTNVHTMVATNITGTINIVEAAIRAGCEAFINTGSSSEYGFKDHAASELERLDPNSCYAVTKATATQYCSFVAREHKVNLATLRLYSVYGPWENPDRLMPTLIVHGLAGELPPLVDPSVARDYVYVDDVVEAYLLATQDRSGEFGAVYNVGTGVQTSIREVVDIAQRALELKAKPEWGSMPNRVWDTNTWMADNQKITLNLGWQPQYTCKQGFHKFIAWFQDNPAITSFYSKHILKAQAASTCNV